MKITEEVNAFEEGYRASEKHYKDLKSKMYTEEEVKQNLIYCISEIAAKFGYANTALLMKAWNEETIKWFEQNKKKP